MRQIERQHITLCRKVPFDCHFNIPGLFVSRVYHLFSQALFALGPTVVPRGPICYMSNSNDSRKLSESSAENNFCNQQQHQRQQQHQQLLESVLRTQQQVMTPELEASLQAFREQQQQHPMLSRIYAGGEQEQPLQNLVTVQWALQTALQRVRESSDASEVVSAETVVATDFQNDGTEESSTGFPPRQ